MSKCVTTVPVTVCFTAADGSRQNLLEHVVYNENGAAIGQTYTTADDTTTIFDVSGGTVFAGQCPTYQPQVQQDDWCDVQADGSIVEFVRRSIINFDENGQVIDPVQVDDFATDLITPYTVTGTPTDECPCGPTAPLGTITDWSQLG